MHMMQKGYPYIKLFNTLSEVRPYLEFRHS